MLFWKVMDYIGEIIALGIDSLFLAAAVKLYLNSTRVVNAVKDIRVYDVNELKNGLKAHNDHEVAYVAVQGSVKAIGAPIHSVNIPDVKGVVQRIRLREHMLTRGSSGFWTDHNRLVQEIYNYVPFVICSGNQSAEVLDPLSADILDLYTVADKYEPATTTVGDHLWSFFMGIRNRGVQSTEDILKEGTMITCIGKVTVSRAGNNLKIQRPSDGSPYFITTSPVSSIICRLQHDITRYKFIIGLSAAVGIAVISLAAYRWWKKRSEKLKREERHRLWEARKLQGDSDELSVNQQCVVCCDCSREVIVFPCGHFCLCEDCSDKITTNCPVCRRVIESKSRAYF